MSGWSPLRPSNGQIAGIVLVVVLIFAYSTIIAQQLLLGLFPALIIFVLYLVWRFLKAIEACADALQRIADNQSEK
jgi:membrane protein implicated in regulation of membrane protease activity